MAEISIQCIVFTVTRPIEQYSRDDLRDTMGVQSCRETADLLELGSWLSRIEKTLSPARSIYQYLILSVFIPGSSAGRALVELVQYLPESREFKRVKVAGSPDRSFSFFLTPHYGHFYDWMPEGPERGIRRGRVPCISRKQIRTPSLIEHLTTLLTWPRSEEVDHE